MRHALLIIEKLTTHPEVKSLQSQEPWRKVNDDVNTNLSKLEQLKPKIVKKRQLWLDAAARRKADRDRWHNEFGKGDEIVGGIDRMSLQGRDSEPVGMGDFGKRELDPSSNKDIAAKLARRELKKRKLSKRSAAPGAGWDQEMPSKTVPSDEDGEFDDLSHRIITAGRRGQDTLINRSERQESTGSRSAALKYHYPTVPRKSTYDAWGSSKIEPLIPTPRRRSPTRSALREPVPLRPHAPPEIPPKLVELDAAPPQRPAKVDASAPTVPAKVSATYASEPMSRSATATPDLKSSDYTFKTSAATESGAPLRTVFLPPDLRSRFLNIARPNTQRNLETCGILCGQLISNAFFTTHLLIPEQEATSDTCDTLNEEGLFDYCDNNDLITLGWIHTHPSQTCFMSSRDLHTHGGYQVQMAESIAIVCAPKHEPSWGVFRLTDPPGLKTVLNCTQTGLFHPHSEPNVYTDALKPGHVWEIPGLEFEVVDLRPGMGFK